MKKYAIVALLSFSSLCVAMDAVKKWPTQPGQEFLMKHLQKRVKQEEEKAKEKLSPKRQKTQELKKSR